MTLDIPPKIEKFLASLAKKLKEEDCTALPDIAKALNDLKNNLPTSSKTHEFLSSSSDIAVNRVFEIIFSTGSRDKEDILFAVDTSTKANGAVNGEPAANGETTKNSSTSDLSSILSTIIGKQPADQVKILQTAAMKNYNFNAGDQTHILQIIAFSQSLSSNNSLSAAQLDGLIEVRKRFLKLLDAEILNSPAAASIIDFGSPEIACELISSMAENTERLENSNNSINKNESGCKKFEKSQAQFLSLGALILRQFVSNPSSNFLIVAERAFGGVGNAFAAELVLFLFLLNAHFKKNVLLAHRNKNNSKNNSNSNSTSKFDLAFLDTKQVSTIDASLRSYFLKAGMSLDEELLEYIFAAVENKKILNISGDDITSPVIMSSKFKKDVRADSVRELLDKLNSAALNSVHTAIASISKGFKSFKREVVRRNAIARSEEKDSTKSLEESSLRNGEKKQGERNSASNNENFENINDVDALFFEDTGGSAEQLDQIESEIVSMETDVPGENGSDSEDAGEFDEVGSGKRTSLVGSVKKTSVKKSLKKKTISAVRK